MNAYKSVKSLSKLMSDYGYKWDGMIPVPFKVAKMLFKAGIVPVYKLYADNTESAILYYDQLGGDTSSAMYGVHVDDWSELIRKGMK